MVRSLLMVIIVSSLVGFSARVIIVGLWSILWNACLSIIACLFSGLLK